MFRLVNFSDKITTDLVLGIKKDIKKNLADLSSKVEKLTILSQSQEEMGKWLRKLFKLLYCIVHIMNLERDETDSTTI